MSIVRYNAVGDHPAPEAPGALEAALTRLPPEAPLVILIHGYKYSPHSATRNPHDHIFSLTPPRGGRSTSWPRHLGLGRGAPGEGLCVAFGWDAWGTIWAAAARAHTAGRALSRLIDAIGARRAGPVDVFAHSLGVRVGLGALPGLAPGRVGRMILLSGAEFQARAGTALATPAGRTAEIVNVTSRANRAFDLMVEGLLQLPWAGGRALGAGIGAAPGLWRDLDIDDPEVRAHLALRGFPTRPPAHSVCHWSGYLRPGLFRLYRAILRDRLPLSILPPSPERDGADARPALWGAPNLPS
ncbi:MAG: hypothetical protein AAGJ74_15705 [Pseudomonadota bacterium]